MPYLHSDEGKKKKIPAGKEENLVSDRFRNVFHQNTRNVLTSGQRNLVLPVMTAQSKSREIKNSHLRHLLDQPSPRRQVKLTSIDQGVRASISGRSL
jgi:hypothetical protein